MVDNSGKHGVVIVLSEAAQAAHYLYYCMPTSSRLASARIKEVIVDLAVIVINAPTTHAEEEARKSCYDYLQEAGAGTQDLIQ